MIATWALDQFFSSSSFISSDESNYLMSHDTSFLLVFLYVVPTGKQFLTQLSFYVTWQVHGEVTDPDIDVFDREKVFIDTILRPLVQRFPQLKVVMEHITTLDAVKFIESCNEGIFCDLSLSSYTIYGVTYI